MELRYKIHVFCIFLFNALLFICSIGAMDANQYVKSPAPVDFDGIDDQECGGSYHADRTFVLQKEISIDSKTKYLQYCESSWTRLPLPIGGVSDQGFIYKIECKSNDTEIGHVHVFLHSSSFSQKPGVISRLHVHPSYRRQGYARKLLQSVYELARSEKCSSVILSVHQGSENQAAINLYTSEGFQRIAPLYAYVMQKSL